MTEETKDKKSKSKKDEMLNKNAIIINPIIQEASANKIVVSFGRMNPPTAGHEKLVNKVKEIARKEGSKAEIYLSHSQDAKKNPLSYDDKVMIAKEAFGPIIQKLNVKTIIEVMKHLSGKYGEVTLVVGQDRVSEFETLLNKYNGKEFNFSSIKVVSAGERDPDAEGVEGMSASKMRDAAKNGQADKFKSGLPKKLHTHADDIYDMVRAGMKLSEETIEEAVLSIDQRRKRSIVMRRYERKMQASRERLKGRIADNKKLVGRARKQAIQFIRQRVAGEKGANYHDLPVAEKIIIDKRVEQRKGAIAKIAARLLSKVRQKEMQRVASLHKVNEAFESYLEEASKPRYNMMHKKDGKLKYDRRFRAFKHIVSEDTETDADILSIIEQVFDVAESISLEGDKAANALVEKAEKSNISIEVLSEVFEEGALLGGNPFDHVNAFIAEGEKKGLWYNIHQRRKKGLPPKKPGEEGYPKTLDIESVDLSGDGLGEGKFIPAPADAIVTKALAALDRLYKSKGDKHSIDSYAYEITKSYNIGVPPRQLAAKYREMTGIKESLDEMFEDYFEEGVNDPSIFKAVFLAGGPGSGKSFVVGKTALTALGFKIINSDDIFERALAKAGLKATPEDIYSPKGQEIRGGAKQLTGKKMDLALNGRLGLVIDGTGKDYEKIEKQATKLKKLGYEVAMIFVNTDLDTAQARNKMRSRSLPEDEVASMWNGVQKNIGKFQNFFGTKMYIIDNSEGSNFDGAVLSTYRKINSWAKVTPSNSQAKSWIASQRSVKEEAGAGLEGTPKLLKKYKKDTPCEEVNEAFDALMEAEEVEITASKMKDFEKFVDRMFEKFKIDFEFTKHFGERMNDERNSPKIKLKELADLIKKIYAKNGNPLKGQAGAELVVKDLQSDLNMPIVVKYDEKNDEIDIVAKTIMRKKNFTTTSPVIKY